MRKPKRLVAVFILFWGLFACQQEFASPGAPARPAVEVPADTLLAQAEVFFDALRYDSAALLFQKAGEEYRMREDWAQYVSCRHKTAACFWASHESEKASALCLQTLSLAREKLGNLHLETAGLYTILGNICADKRTESGFRQSLEYYGLALDAALQHFRAPHPDLALAYGRFGITHWLIDDYTGALPWYERALACLDTLSPRTAAAHYKIYDNVALLYQSMGHFRKANDYFTKARDVALHTLGQRDSKVVKELLGMAETRLSLGDAEEALDLLGEAWTIEQETGAPAANLKSFILWNMGDCFMARENYAAAAERYRQSLAYWDAGNPDHRNGLTINLQKLGNACLKQGQTAEALRYLQHANNLITKGYGAQSFNRVNVLGLIALAYQEQNRLPLAARCFREALLIAQKKVGNHHPATARLKKQLAELYFGAGWLNESFRRAEEARSSYLMRPFLPGEKPSVSDINNLPEFIEIHHLMGQIRAARYRQNREKPALRQSVTCLVEALSLTDSLKLSLVTKSARQAAQKQVFAIAEDALESLYSLWSDEHIPEYATQAFHFMEKSKAAELLAALHDFDAKQSAGVPADWLERETLLKTQLSSCRHIFYDSEQANDFKTALAQQRYFEVKHTLDSFMKALEKQFPKYHALKYNTAVASLPQLKSFAAAQNVHIVEYLYGNRALYSFYLSPDSTSWSKLEHNGADTASLDRRLSGFLAVLSDKNAQQADPAACFDNAGFLFQKLLPEAIRSSPCPLVVVPDGRLCYLPFEALLTEPYRGGFANAPYLFRLKSVQYAWSASLLISPVTTDRAQGGMLHVVPFNHLARDSLAPLPNSLRDVPVSAGAAVLSGATATSAGFLKNAPRYTALHLSTHADAGGSTEPGIELYDRRLTLPEIYAQRFRASLVSLSACETGKGQFAQGEGVMSLARAFAYAGAQSLVASYWRVNERSTAELFSAFYGNLKNGLPKAEALRQAKLHYLASAEPDARKAPFHWAAFTLTGADGTVELGKNDGREWYLPTGIFVFILLIVRILGWKNIKNRLP